MSERGRPVGDGARSLEQLEAKWEYIPTQFKVVKKKDCAAVAGEAHKNGIGEIRCTIRTLLFSRAQITEEKS